MEVSDQIDAMKILFLVKGPSVQLIESLVGPTAGLGHIKKFARD
jgi:hypothetical protein